MTGNASSSGGRTLARVGEWGLLEKLVPRLPGAGDRRFLVGPGDDAAVFRARPGTNAWVVTTDMLVEGVHFDLRWTSPEDLGWKSLAVNLSDLAAMGGVRPAVAVIAAGLPASTAVSFVERFYRGLGKLARRCGLAVAGGDTVRSDMVVISPAVLGELPRGRRVLRRSGARAGDVLMATGTLGDAAAGLKILQSRGRGILPALSAAGKTAHGQDARAAAAERFLARRLLRPEPRLDLAGKISQVPGVTAMMDSSDGLWRSARILARASGVGIRIESDLLPISPSLRSWAGKKASGFALFGGEDYELILTAGPRAARALEERGWARAVGQVTAGREVKVVPDIPGRSAAYGFEHFDQGD